MSMNQFHDLRNLHSEIIYSDYSWEVAENQFNIEFHFHLKPDIHFRPTIKIKCTEIPLNTADKECIDRLVFNIGLIELLSYWKAACPREINVAAGAINENAEKYWTTLFYKGMGEFFYTNRIDARNQDIVTLHHCPPTVASKICDDISSTANTTNDANLLMLSGGKDSAFSALLLESRKVPFNCLLVNPPASAKRLAGALNCTSPIIVERRIAPELLELNQRGYLNGHTPFSAILASIGVLCAKLYGYRNVIASNEQGCNSPNISSMDGEVNHQYSKTFHFEKMFNDYVHSELAPGIDYFSFTRPINEIQIVSLLASKYNIFAETRSCNRLQTKDQWCLKCPKCVSVFTLSYPFLNDEQLRNFFSGNVFDFPENSERIDQLCGFDLHRPFECVAPVDEIKTALWMGIEKHLREEIALPPVLEYAKTFLLEESAYLRAHARQILDFWSDDNILPAQMAEILKASVDKGSI